MINQAFRKPLPDTDVDYSDAGAAIDAIRPGERADVPVTCRLDTDEEVSIYEAGGVLQRFAQDFLASEAEPA